MSRRRKPPAVLPNLTGAMPVVCTRRGTHRPVEIGWVREGAGRTVEWVRDTRRPDLVTPWRPDSGEYTFRFRCRDRTCDVDKQMHESAVYEAITGLRAPPGDKPAVFDVSLLPF
jgi:hypothetical protein